MRWRGGTRQEQHNRLLIVLLKAPMINHCLKGFESGYYRIQSLSLWFKKGLNIMYLMKFGQFDFLEHCNPTSQLVQRDGDIVDTAVQVERVSWSMLSSSKDVDDEVVF